MTSIEYDNLDLTPIIDSQNNNNMANMASNQTLFLSNRDAIEQATRCMDTTAIVQGQDFTNLENMASAERLGIAIKDDIYKTSQHNRNAIDRTADLNREVTDNYGTTIALGIERTGADNVATTERTNSQVLSTVERNRGVESIRKCGFWLVNSAIEFAIKLNLIEFADELGFKVLVFKEVLTNMALDSVEKRDLMYKHNYSHNQNTTEILLNDNKNTVGIEHQAVVNLYKTKKDLVHVETSLELQAVKDTACIQLEALKLQSESAAEMAACCCELKEEVAKTEFQTQQMVRDIESNRIRDALSAATTQNLINKLKCRPHPCPQPCPPQPCPPQPCPCPPPCPHVNRSCFNLIKKKK